MGKIEEFTDLVAWQEAHKLVLDIYRITQRFPNEERYGLASQMRRAAVSISSNIAEGFSWHSATEKDRFYCMSRGSLLELHNQLLISRDVGFLNPNEFPNIITLISRVRRLNSGLTKSASDR